MHAQETGGRAASRSSFPMSMLTKPAPQGLLLRAFVIILPATLWRSVHPGREHNSAWIFWSGPAVYA
eukprot:1157366-Pelagomonas_calceolata.AAC.2